MEFSSKLLENAVNEVAMLPGIGKRTAMRLVLQVASVAHRRKAGGVLPVFRPTAMVF